MNKQGENGIPYCDYTWNPVVGCLHGCSYCFAERIAKRFNGSKAFPNGFNPTFHEGRLTEPMKIKKPSRIFVSDMGDLFGDWVPDEWINDVLMMVQGCSRHTFLFLTKNPKRYREFDFPENAWIGTSVENQAAADERIPQLLQASAAVRFISAEPLLGPVDLRLGPYPPCSHKGCYNHVSHPCEGCGRKQGRLQIDWVIAGGESGPGARPMHPDWVRSLRDQCQAAGTKFFFKSWGDWLPNAHEYNCNPGGVDYEQRHELVGNTAMCRVGKKKSGRLIDSRTWDETPCLTKR